MTKKKIITRFPPSPTGHLHVGGARTALFNWLYARHTKGEFVLRIEDTDRERSTKESTDSILEALKWLGIDWDHGPYFQSERLDIYQKYAQKLINTGLAYYCSCSPEEVTAMRKSAMKAGQNPKYDGTCREKGLSPGPNLVIRFKCPVSGVTMLPDIVKGHITIQNTELDDFVIQRTDQTPTYNFAVVVDDITMKINTIIRGDDHISNTPKQIQLYHALGHPLPDYAHVPMVLGHDRVRLSKRHGAASIIAYREMGYLPEALINYLVRLGWSHGDQEFFTRAELIENFNLENIGNSPGIFDSAKLTALNADHIKKTPLTELSTLLLPYLEKTGLAVNADTKLKNIIKTLINRSKTLEEMAAGALFYFADSISYDKKAAKFLKPAIKEALELLKKELEKLNDFEPENVEQTFQYVMEQTKLKLGKIAQPMRAALTGKTASPGIFEIMEILGKEKVLARMDAAIMHCV